MYIDIINLGNLDKGSVLCRYYANGFCAMADLCPFSHSKPVSRAKSPTSTSQPSVKPIEAVSLKPSESTPADSSNAFAVGSADTPVILNGLASLKISDSDLPQLESFVVNNTGSYSSITGAKAVSKDKAASKLKKGQSVVPKIEKSSELCVFALTGKCRYGMHCRNVHGLQCPRCLKFCLHPDDLTQNEDHIQACLEAPLATSLELDEHKRIECGICFEQVLSKPDPRFGLLSCEHPFCITCIRTWRLKHAIDSTNIRSCPLCRTVTYFVVPSSMWVVDSDEKRAVIEAYKKKMSVIPCKHFDQGRANCPFGSSCFYSHKNPSGTVEKPQLRSLVGQNEKPNIMRETRLSDFIMFDSSSSASLRNG